MEKMAHQEATKNVSRLLNVLAQSCVMGICPSLQRLDKLIMKLREMPLEEMDFQCKKAMDIFNMEMETEEEFLEFLKKVETMLGI